MTRRFSPATGEAVPAALRLELQVQYDFETGGLLKIRRRLILTDHSPPRRRSAVIPGQSRGKDILDGWSHRRDSAVALTASYANRMADGRLGGAVDAPHIPVPAPTRPQVCPRRLRRCDGIRRQRKCRALGLRIRVRTLSVFQVSPPGGWFWARSGPARPPACQPAGGISGGRFHHGAVRRICPSSGVGDRHHRATASGVLVDARLVPPAKRRVEKPKPKGPQVPQVDPEIVRWGRETVRLTADDTAAKLVTRDAGQDSGTQTDRFSCGNQCPSWEVPPRFTATSQKG